MYSNVVTAIDKILRSYYVSTLRSHSLKRLLRTVATSVTFIPSITVS